MHDNVLFKKVPVEVHNKSGFDPSFEHIFTAKTGTLVPVLAKYLVPGDKFRVNLSNLEVTLPPVVTDFYGSVDAKLEAFFVPLRILTPQWKKIVEGTSVGNTPSLPDIVFSDTCTTDSESQVLPLYDEVVEKYDSHFGPGSLVDFLGMKSPYSVSRDSEYEDVYNFYALYRCQPFLWAYHKIWNDWYRNPFVQVDIFGDTIPDAFQFFIDGDTLTTDIYNLGVDANFADSVNLFDLRQRNWPKDYFTSATPEPQYGDAASVSIADGKFTIATLRAANSLQKFVERNNIGGGRYADLILGQFGVLPSDALVDRPIYLGHYSTPVYSRTVFQTAPTSDADSRNPFVGKVGSTGGSAFARGSGHLFDVNVTEQGVVMVLFSLVPRSMISTGNARELKYRTYADFPNPMLAGIGNQAIMQSEISPISAGATDSAFGYTDRYAEAKYYEDQISGLIRDGQSLQHFALQRSFDTAPTLGTEFIQIPTDYLDQVTAVDEASSQYGAVVDLAFGIKKVSTLPAYCIPTLDHDHDVHTIMVDKGGRQL